MGAKQFIGGIGGTVINGNANFITLSEYCELNENGLNTGRRMAKQMDVNPYSVTFKEEKIIVVAAVSDVCPISDQPFFKPTGNRRCVNDENNRHTGAVEVEEKDVNPHSPNFNQTRWTAAGDNLTDCPLPELPFLRVLAENVDAGSLDFVISATIKDSAGQSFTVQRASNGSTVNYAEIFQPFGDYTITNVSINYSAGVAAAKFISRIYSTGIFDKAFVQTDVVNQPVGGACSIIDLTEYALTLNVNKVIHFAFSERVAAGSFSAVQTKSFNKNDCPGGAPGSSVSFSKTYTSTISQADADAKKANDISFDIEGQSYANDSAHGASCGVFVPRDFYLDQYGRRIRISGGMSINCPITVNVIYNITAYDYAGNNPVTTGPFNDSVTLNAGSIEGLSTPKTAGLYDTIDFSSFTFSPKYCENKQIYVNGQPGEDGGGIIVP